ncbi:SdrD B-like domain-containing protein, partial [Ruania rhizosphaerae]|uniref:SdrD B-like domain-containing protein n=1 Tax=Ruania rhizosphaerae TaxID=1840413 RepID=UPI00190F89C1
TSGDLTQDGDRDPSLDFGFVPDLVSVGDYVWIDEDRDGIQDEGETPVEGVEITLLDENGEVVATTTTDEDGYYVFTDLDVNTDYTIEFPTTITVDGDTYPLTTAGAGDDTSLDSNPNQDTGRYSFTTPATGANSAEPGQADIPTIDAGYTPPQVDEPSPSPTEGPTPNPVDPMPSTGVPGSLILTGGLAALALLVGIVLLTARRRALHS